MPAWIITIGLPLLKQLLQEAPQLRADIAALFAKEQVTDADWAALHARIAGQTYEDLVPHSGLIPGVHPAPGGGGSGA